MRGKEPDTIITELTDGITPAYAGKRVPRVYGLSVPGDHPRVCGEKCMALFRNCAVLGSPPRMRGKAALCALDRAAVGITPAYAGKRTLVGECPKPLWDHPRVCGEKNNTAKTYSNMEGSPPRMRGKGQAGRKVVVELGITPAYAGKSTPDRLFLYHLGDHPRVCGEKPGGRLRELVYPGSPPRVRGKAHDGRQVLRGLRRHLKCDWDGHLRLVQVGNVVHERALMPDVHESQSRRTPQRHNDRMGQPVQAGMHGGSHGCRGRAAAPKCPAHHPWLLPLCRMVIRPRP